MKQSGTIFIYSRFKPVEIRSGMFNHYIQGAPALIKSDCGSEEWIQEILKQLSKNTIGPEVAIAEVLKNTSGLFSFISGNDNEFILASDIIRSFPVFYGFHQNRLFITDNLEEFQKECGPLEIDYEMIEEFLESSLIYGKRTVYRNVYGIQAGEVIHIKNNEISSERYYVFEPALEPDHFESLSGFTKAFDDVFLFIFSRMIKLTPGVNRWVVPLSGGHDSRLVVNYLHRLGAKNVICFSYGTPGNEQSRISKKVAEAVGYEWHFVEYTEQKWQALHTSGLFDDYINFSFNGVSTPHLQDFLAVHELKAAGKIVAGDVFLPGHTVVTVSVFNEDTLKLKSEEEALNYVYSKVCTKSNLPMQKSPIRLALQEMLIESHSKPENFMAYTDWQERQSKFITNSVKTYEYFGFESRQPMWAREIVDFWLKIPAKERVGRDPLFETEKHGGLVEQLSLIPFIGEPSTSIRHSVSGILKKLIPARLVIRILRLTGGKARLNEGLNNIYALRANSVKELLDPVEDFPHQTHDYFRDYLQRHTYQTDPNILTSLYTIRRLLDRNKWIEKES